jgi:hypothetical protein
MYGMETTIDTHLADDCLNHDCRGSVKVEFRLDSASGVSLFNNYSS